MTLPLSTILGDEPRNLMPLEEWREQMAYHPFHFWQLANSLIPVNSKCSMLVLEHAYQSADTVGREEVRKAIIAAEMKIRPYLGYSVMPHYVIETLPWPRYPDARFDYRGYSAADGRWKTVRLSEGYIKAAGVEKLDLIDDAEVTYSDEDGDGVIDTFTLSAATTVTDQDEIAVYFAEDDRYDDSAAGERWRIAPVTVRISGGTVTVRGRAWLCVRPILYEGYVKLDNPAVDPNGDVLAETLEVYRRYTSAGTEYDTAQAVLVWETRPWPEWACPTGSSDAAGEAYALARVGLRDARLGIVDVAESVYHADSASWSLARGETWCRPPDRVIVRYLAGYPLENGRMNPRFRRMMARFSAAELSGSICACDSANRELYDAQFDLSRAGGDEQYSTTPEMLGNEFGRRRGQFEAWQFVKSAALRRGVAL